MQRRRLANEMSERAHVAERTVQSGNPLLRKKPMDWLLNEAKATGEHTLKRTLGPVSLTALGVGAIIGAGIFVLSGLGAHYAGPGLTLSFIISGFGCAFAGLCYAEFAALIPLAGSAYTYAYAALGELFAWIIGWDLTLEYAMGASTVSSGWSNHFVEFLNIFGLKIPLWLAYDHWTALRTAENEVARQMASASDSSLVVGTQAYLGQSWRHPERAVPRTSAARPRLGECAATLRHGDRLQFTGVRDRPCNHRNSGGRNSRERYIQCRHRFRQSRRGSFYHRARIQVCEPEQLGPRLAHVRAHGIFRNWRRAPLTSFLRTSDSTLFRPPRRKQKIRSVICPSESSRRCWFARFSTSSWPLCSPEWCRGRKSILRRRWPWPSSIAV